MTKLQQTIERKVNLITGETYEELERTRGIFAATDYPRRATGRTTAIAMAAIAMAMETPTFEVRCTDHCDYKGARQSRGGEHMLDNVRGVISKLGLVGFDVGLVNTCEVRLTYNPFGVVYYDLRK